MVPSRQHTRTPPHRDQRHLGADLPTGFDESPDNGSVVYVIQRDAGPWHDWDPDVILGGASGSKER